MSILSFSKWFMKETNREEDNLNKYQNQVLKNTQWQNASYTYLVFSEGVQSMPDGLIQLSLFCLSHG